MKVLVTHHYWDRPGGGELVAGAFALAFSTMGHHVELTATTRFCVSCYKEWFGMDLTKFKVHSLPFKLRAFGIYLRALSWVPAVAVIPRMKPDLVFIDFYQTKPIVRLKRRYGFKTIEYIHFPFETVYGPRKIRSWRDDPYLAERYGKFPWDIYLMGSLWLSERFNRGNPFKVHELVMANSRWTADLVKQIHGEYPLVVNPPLPPNVNVAMEPKPFEERQDIVVMVGRFSNEKRYHWVVSEVMPRLVKEVPDVRLVIIGGTGTVPSENYFEKTIELARKSGVFNNVVLMKNAPGDAKLNALDSAKVFLHATINEHWGVAVAEAMARGLPVVVHRSGGAWSDLAMSGEVGLGYENADEAVNAIAKLLTDGRAWGDYSRRSLERVRDITFDRFVERLAELVKKML
ncbi:glycosyl transferase, group 1 [Vulcanisaeta moutnovskia 768-28]|uniref:Glycosyl transferase, group 1 n=1 Tax=Vulcanisaeta moutnovskia (strain 768-28) TaxID=985053 RepID=F0QUU0_VULM7|nr:glycosyltransferase family 4 protein [Vulcanisaeta moutnovskia]ADY01922.1 glycosyl transferase, group 1 [Vulcanisaeta moutnovskia 768-28]